MASPDPWSNPRPLTSIAYCVVQNRLPTQAPIKFEMVLNVGTAKALGPVVPANLLALGSDRSAGIG